MPRTVRGKQTRIELVHAARAIFERDGYIDTRVADIVQRAGLSHGSFYHYFHSKEDIFKAVIEEFESDLFTTGPDVFKPHSDGYPDVLTDPVGAVAVLAREYFRAYRRNARLIEVLHQAASVVDDFAKVRDAIRHRFVERTTERIQYMREHGVADDDLDIHIVASLLRAMSDQFAFNWFVAGDEFDEDEAVDVFAQAWTRVVGARPVTRTK